MPPVRIVLRSVVAPPSSILYVYMSILFRCARLHVPVVGRRLPLQPPPLLRPRRGSRHAPRPLLISQGDLRNLRIRRRTAF